MTDQAPIRILIVDDDPMMIDILSRVLARAGIEAAGSAGNGRAALDELDNAPYDLVFCDIDMPTMDGVEFLRHLRNRPRPPAVVVLSSTPESIRESVKKLGLAHQLRILGALPKPATFDAVLDMLDRFNAKPLASAATQNRGYFTLSPADLLALMPDSIELEYQPIHHAETGRVVALEALARLRHPTVGMVGPAIFVPVCEQAGATSQLLRTVLSKALDALARLRKDGYPELVMSVNMSAADLTTPDLVDEIVSCVSAADLPTDAVIIELTESRALHRTTLPVEILTRLRVKGLGLGVYDFGTGYASLKQLENIPFTELKVDQMFVRGANNDERKRQMLASTIGLAKELGLTTVAEGVETDAELALLRDLGCECIQGFRWSRPMDFPTLHAFLAANKSTTPDIT